MRVEAGTIAREVPDFFREFAPNCWKAGARIVTFLHTDHENRERLGHTDVSAKRGRDIERAA
jgi:hypothetical protein